ncbi:MAG TPA: hypothetical protein VJN93_05555 [Candidatus Acidoferrum sp.]|nr:hypothetical protein [Candidatus Acidoferrum sp.]
MRAQEFVRPSPHRVEPLILRGGLAHTFGSLASFLAGLFLILGLYLLADAFEHPINAQAIAVLGAALSITLAAILSFYLLKPKTAQKPRASRIRRAG